MLRLRTMRQRTRTSRDCGSLAVVALSHLEFVMSKRREEWQQDVSARQRNVVFPDTVQNEARLWRNLIGGKEKLTTVQAVGIALIFLLLVAIFWESAAPRFRSGTSGSLFERLVGTLAGWVIPLGVFGVFFLLLRWRVRRALLPGKHPDRSNVGVRGKAPGV